MENDANFIEIEYDIISLLQEIERLRRKLQSEALEYEYKQELASDLIKGGEVLAAIKSLYIARGRAWNS